MQQARRKQGTWPLVCGRAERTLLPLQQRDCERPALPGPEVGPNPPWPMANSPDERSEIPAWLVGYLKSRAMTGDAHLALGRPRRGGNRSKTAAMDELRVRDRRREQHARGRREAAVLALHAGRLVQRAAASNHSRCEPRARSGSRRSAQQHMVSCSHSHTPR